jgi:hypothetical protein
MDQRSILLYLTRRELAAVAIHDDLVETFGLEAISYSSLISRLLEGTLATSNSWTTFSESNTEPDNCDEAILLALNEQSFVPIGQLARLTHLPKASIYRRLPQ